ncbi:MAG: hypothetical protein GF309_09275 [Candidatus Lokiarchaeota archaeon]|nr:hypothetical protein [Candidatus Lokiarchaeota archaeon]
MNEEPPDSTMQDNCKSLEILSGTAEKGLGALHIVAGISLSIAQLMIRPWHWFVDFGLIMPYSLVILGIVCFILPGREWFKETLLPRVEEGFLLTPSDRERYMSFGRTLNLTIICFGWAWAILCQAGWTSLFYLAMTFPGPFNIIGKVIAELTFLGIFAVYPGGLFLAFSPLENTLIEHHFDDIRPIHEKANAIAMENMRS